jgi:AhpD family alkylhydroperoxidase
MDQQAVLSSILVCPGLLFPFVIGLKAGDGHEPAPAELASNLLKTKGIYKMAILQARMKNPVMILPDVLKAAYAMGACANSPSVPTKTLTLIHLRASQINGCAFCVEMHARELKKSGETDERLAAVASWRDSPCFTDAERAALALTEAATRLNDRADAVPDQIWDEAARHYDEQSLAVLVVNIAMINFWNRINVTTRQVAGTGPR